MATLLKHSILFLCMGTYLHISLHGNASQTQYIVSVYGDVSTCISPWQRFSNTVYCFCVWGRIYMYLSMATLLKHSILFLCMGTYLHVSLHGNASQTQYIVSVYGDVSTCIPPWQRFSNTVYCFGVWGRIYMYLSMATLLKHSILFPVYNTGEFIVQKRSTECLSCRIDTICRYNMKRETHLDTRNLPSIIKNN